MTVKIKVEHLIKIFGRHPQSVLKILNSGMTKDEILEKTGHTVGVWDVSFEVGEGEVFAIMGLSGSGKSTLIRCLNLLNKPTSGKIYVDGENILEYSREQLSRFRKDKLAMVFQHFGLFTHRTCLLYTS
ncbi:MAG TPA: ABC transporter ATP-binding protein, partial [Firmicutes bacterium]|nr:ABC transporter ATP-binding protein [Bacillota bacterium]